ncbi:hypothetical protein CQW23_35026 [Capsicum baccatum]|uniref:Uncharacterized protein n=1 Tax=Capsicum baccatum TaxID=33114 RepID=A0A2G2UX83_CAPBA|nr:hypothetical protein CQW23_35026 [Capsicum baccatum]
MDNSLIHAQSPYIEMMKNNFFFFRSSTNDANKTSSPSLKSKEVSSCRSVSLSSRSFYDSGSGKKNFTDLNKSPHGHSKKVHLRNLVMIQAELDSRTRRLETEKNELQSVLEKKLDRRSSDWSLKLKKYQIEQHRLRERARDLAKQNVSLQREVFSFNEKEEKVKELKLETLLTTLLREKLYYEEMDIKQLQADLAATVRGNDILKCEVRNVLDALSCATPKLKYLELQVLLCSI